MVSGRSAVQFRAMAQFSLLLRLITHNMKVRLLTDIYEDWSKDIDWSLFAHTAQSYFVFARISIKTSETCSAVGMSHQMVELFVKAIILYKRFGSKYDDFEKYRKKAKNFHDVVELIKENKNDISVFKSILSNNDYIDFLTNISQHYIDARFGQVSVEIHPNGDLACLDGIFQEFTRYFYNLTKVSSLQFLRIPNGTQHYFKDSTILDFTGHNCRVFGNIIGNIKIKV